MTKVVLNIVGFILLFSLIFACLQPVFVRTDQSGMTVAMFYNEPIDSLEVIILGSSGARAFVSPAVIWEEAGVASLNLSTFGSLNTASQYYLFQEVLRFQSPSVVFAEIPYSYVRQPNFDEPNIEARLRQVIDFIRWSSVKYEAILDILSNSETQTFIDYLFPLLRYHDRTDLEKRDFDFSYRSQRNLYMGVWEKDDENYKKQTRPDDLLDNGDIPEVYDMYMIKLIELCRERDIDFVFVNPAICREDMLTVGWSHALQNYADELGVELLDFNTPELYKAIDMDASKDFFDELHVNLSGATKASGYLANYLQEEYNLPDRRQSQYDPHWDDVVNLYHTRYNELLSKFPESE